MRPFDMTAKYSIWQDARTGDYEVVRWDEGVPTIVQTNIRTYQKARQARLTWAKREREKDAQA